MKIATTAVLTVAGVVLGAVPAAAHQPHPYGERVAALTYHKVGANWKTKVIGIDKNANAEIENENEFNDPPKDGYRYVMVRVRCKKVTSGEGDAYWDLTFRLYGKETKNYYRPTYAVIPDDLAEENSVGKDGYVTANVAFEVKNVDAKRRLPLRVSDEAEWDYKARVWYQTHGGSWPS